MKQPKTFLLLAVIVAVLIIGVAYAAINNIDFYISGTVTATPDQSNFDVEILNPSYSGEGKANISTEDNRTINVNISGFKSDGDSGKVHFKIVNYSKDISARLITDMPASGTISLEDPSRSNSQY